ncbi:TatD-related deoxyribonuclease [Coriobacterium glomerans PW2]|uniref:TatD-related deoxyribonuclease n=1 Tax=Coriobacterium glomerans (strain ATCC 49209 / DSM 20642 / JCM 10262 / PW2) TaxID=700015 RepID=F2NA81_CORGP|nr:TatD family hydrolase [Coriobacterium glomerans]AEB06475.1 TatD-related deoxyribonuclease [Coriobacterium glomerans PW2]
MTLLDDMGTIEGSERSELDEEALRARLRPVFARRHREHVAPAALAPLADTHTHLLGVAGGDAAAALTRAALAGVRLLVTLLDPVCDKVDPGEFRTRLDEWIAVSAALLRGPGSPRDASADPSGIVAASTLGEPAQLFDRVGYLIGVHPYGAAGVSDAVMREMRAELADPRCLGVGEIGLDYHLDDASSAPRSVQLAAFAGQLELARNERVPVELHLRHEAGDERRRSHEDALRVLFEVGVPEPGCVVHCFTEDRTTMERFLEAGCLIAFGGAATFKRNGEIRDAFAACPLSRILFETDAPYLAPEPVRGIPCEPAMIAFTADALARDRAERTGEDPHAIARAAWSNAVRLFG